MWLLLVLLLILVSVPAEVLLMRRLVRRHTPDFYGTRRGRWFVHRCSRVAQYAGVLLIVGSMLYMFVKAEVLPAPANAPQLEAQQRQIDQAILLVLWGLGIYLSSTFVAASAWVWECAVAARRSAAM